MRDAQIVRCWKRAADNAVQKHYLEDFNYVGGLTKAY